MDGIELDWVESIEKISPAVWYQCFAADDVLHAYELHKAAELAALKDVTFHYLLAREAGEVVAILPCFSFRASLTTVASELVKRAVMQVRRFWRGFLYLDIFIAGTPIAIYKDLIGIRHSPSDLRFGPLLTQLGKAVKMRACTLGIDVVLIKEITGALLPYVKAALSGHYSFVEGPATTYLYLGEPDTGRYRERLRYRYRNLMKGRQRRFLAAGYQWQICRDFAPYAEQMETLYLQVLHRAKTRFMTLNSAFFKEVSQSLGEQAFAILAFDANRLIAFGLVVQDRHGLHPLYLGMSYDDRDRGALYFNLLYKTIEIAEDAGRPLVQLGQTGYAAKASIGAVTEHLYLAVASNNSLLNLLIHRFGNVLFPPMEVPRQHRTFRDMESNNQALRRFGVNFEPHSE